MNRHFHSQDGAVAVIVAVFVAFVGIGLLVIALDGGSLWQSRRALVIDTDAAAHAGAVAMASDWLRTDAATCDETVGTGEARRMLEVNDPDGNDEVVDVSAGCDPDEFTGWVRMAALQSSPGFVSGRTDLAAGGTTTVEFALEVDELEGLAVCGDLFSGSDFLEAFELPEDRGVAIPYHKAVQTLIDRTDNNTACGVESQWAPPGGPSPTTPGGWGWLDGSPPCEVDWQADENWCDVKTGNSIQALRNLTEVTFPIFDRWDGVPGTGADLNIVGYVVADLVGVCNIPGGGNEPANPADCTDSRIGTSYSGNPEFIILSNPEIFRLSYPETAMFNEARYAICDVGAGTDFCP